MRCCSYRKTLALGMLEHYLAAVDSAGLERDRFQIVINRSRQNDDATISPHEGRLRQTFLRNCPTIIARSARQ
jgi:hypothetical protein